MKARHPIGIFRGVVAVLFSNEMLFALFLTAGNYKADPRLAFVQSHVDLTVLFLALSVLAFFWRGIRKGLPYKMPRSSVPVAILYLFLSVVMIAGLLYSPSKVYALDKTARFIVITGWAFFGVMLIIRDLQSLQRFTWALVVIATSMSFDAVVNWAGMQHRGFVTAFGSNYIALARMGGLGLIALIGFLIPMEDKKSVRLFLWGTFLLLAFSLFIPGARGPVIAFLVAFLLYLIGSIRIPKIRIERFGLKVFLVGVLVSALLIPLGATSFHGVLMRRFQILFSERGSSVVQRLDYWNSAINLGSSSPIWGIGTGGFGVAYYGQDIRAYPHDLLLEVWSENGLIGLLVLLAMLVITLGRQLARLPGLRAGRQKLIIRYLVVLGCFMLLNALVSGNINDNRILFSLIALNAISDRLSQSEQKYRRNVGGRGQEVDEII